MMKNLKHFLLLILLLMLFVSLPQLLSNYLVSVFVLIFTFASLGIAWNIVGGYGGQVSWCHSAFTAIGAYSGAIMYSRLGVSPLISMFVGVVISVLFATLIGKVTFRYRGPYFAISTIAFVEILRIILVVSSDLTRGSAGITIPYIKAEPWNLIFSSDKEFYYITLGLLVLALMLTVRIDRSKFGHYLRVIKEDEDAAKSLGIRTSMIKLLAFQISAAVTSVVGTVYAFFLTYVEPNSIAGTDLAIRIGAVVIIGGIGTIWGPVIGAFILIPVIELANFYFGAQGATQLIYGLALVIVVILQPEGMIVVLQRIVEKVKIGMKKVSLGGKSGG